MNRTAKLLSALVFAIGITGALAFGAQEAVACVECVEWTGEPCADKTDPEIFCKNLCINELGCADGECFTLGGDDQCHCTV